VAFIIQFLYTYNQLTKIWDIKKEISPSPKKRVKKCSVCRFVVTSQKKRFVRLFRTFECLPCKSSHSMLQYDFMKEEKPFIPFVSVIIPCRNEEKFIESCLNSIIGQSYPKDKLEVLVVDGMSEDKTREIIARIHEKHEYIKLLENPKKFTPFAFNIGVKHSKGEFIIIMGAHASYDHNYIRGCIDNATKYNADNTGGVALATPKNNTITANAIVHVLSCKLGTGGAKFRKSFKKPTYADTVFGGCYSRNVFEKIGLFNESLHRSQDIEFNIRLKKAGGKILLVPDIICHYYPKSTLREFLKHEFKEGFWIIYASKFTKIKFKLRHYIPLIFTSTLIATGIGSLLNEFALYAFMGILIPYATTLLITSTLASIKEKNMNYIAILPMAFIIRHIIYGFGSIWGVLKMPFNS